MRQGVSGTTAPAAGIPSGGRCCRCMVSVAVSVPAARNLGVGGRLCGLHAHTW
jgi:hypothetical protein